MRRYGERVLQPKQILKIRSIVKHVQTVPVFRPVAGSAEYIVLVGFGAVGCFWASVLGDSVRSGFFFGDCTSYVEAA